MRATVIPHAAGMTEAIVDRVACPPSIDAEALVWSATGPEQDSTARLLTTIDIAGVKMHLEAFALNPEDAVQSFAKLADTAEFDFKAEEDALYTFNEQAMQTINLNGRDYLLVAYPFGD